MKRTIILIAAILTLILPAAVVGGESAAEYLSGACVYEGSNGSSALIRLWDRAADTAYSLDEGGYIRVSWDDKVAARSACLLFFENSGSVSIALYDSEGAQLQVSTRFEGQRVMVIELPAEARTLELTCDLGVRVGQLTIHGQGELSAPFYSFAETPCDLDFLIVSTHPDDDALFMGAIMPIFGAEQGYDGSIAYITCRNAVRMVEAHNGAWTMGLRTYPIFAGFPDVYQTSEEELYLEFALEKLTLYLARLYRQTKPEVVFSHDLEGEYGHWQHSLVAEAVLAAIESAADPAYDPESVEQYGVFQVQKCYLHLYPDRQITLETRVPLAAFDGLTALEVAKLAYREHESQQGLWFSVSDTGEYSLAEFGLAYSYQENASVEVFEDAFTPEPTISPTPEPTITPLIEPTIEPATTTGSFTAPVETVSVSANESASPDEPPSMDASASVRAAFLYPAAALFLIAIGLMLFLYPALKRRMRGERALLICLAPLLLALILVLAMFLSPASRAEEKALPPDDDSFYSADGEIVIADVENGYWEYRNDSLGIFIERRNSTVETETGEEPLVYFVAHIYMRNYDSFRAGFPEAGQSGTISANPWRLARREKAVLAITGDNLIHSETELKGALIRNGRVYSNHTGAEVMALFDDMRMKIYLRGEKRASELLEMGVRNTASFGPWLIMDGVQNDAVSRHRLNRINPRCGLGMIEQGHFVAIVVDGRQNGYSYGLNLYDFQQLFVAEGCVQAYNLDGGCSTGMVFMGEHLNSHDGREGAADFQRSWPDALMWGYSSLVPSEDEPILNDGNRLRNAG
ncbi:MAG: phosphodiester glycosidase family protein [Clostridia bacterium]|nr:phosphodiester glycosidase family protein [Clostridia bacterium]